MGHETLHQSLHLRPLWGLFLRAGSGSQRGGWDSIGPFGTLLTTNDVINGQMNALAIDPRDANIL
jgi:hypothetical protein